jgi:hypothetical protein
MYVYLRLFATIFEIVDLPAAAGPSIAIDLLSIPKTPYTIFI